MNDLNEFVNQQFRDGRLSDSDVENPEDAPQQLDMFSFDQGLLTLMSSNESAFCADQTGTNEVYLLGEGLITLILHEDECSLRVGTNCTPLVPVHP